MDIFTGQFSEVMVLGEFNVDLLTVSSRSYRQSTIFRDLGTEQIVASSTCTTVARSSSALLKHV